MSVDFKSGRPRSRCRLVVQRFGGQDMHTTDASRFKLAARRLPARRTCQGLSVLLVVGLTIAGWVPAAFAAEGDLTWTVETTVTLRSGSVTGTCVSEATYSVPDDLEVTGLGTNATAQAGTGVLRELRIDASWTTVCDPARHGTSLPCTMNEEEGLRDQRPATNFRAPILLTGPGVPWEQPPTGGYNVSYAESDLNEMSGMIDSVCTRGLPGYTSSLEASGTLVFTNVQVAWENGEHTHSLWLSPPDRWSGPVTVTGTPALVTFALPVEIQSTSSIEAEPEPNAPAVSVNPFLPVSPNCNVVG